jgi:transposase IS200 family protein
MASKDAGAPGTSGNAAIPGGGWYSRGYLPHFDQPGLYQSITFRLHDSVPTQVIDQWKDELHWRENLPSDSSAVVTLRQRIVTYEDAGCGACWLREGRIAALVENALLFFDGQRYRLIAWCIMPNHVHVLIETFPGYPLFKVLHSWKSFTALKANQLLGRKGEFCARERRHLGGPKRLTLSRQLSQTF